MTTYRCGKLFADDRLVDNALLTVQDGRISAISEENQIEADFDLSQHLVLPAPVNGHLHSFQSLLRGLADDRPFSEWRDVLYRYTPLLTPDDVQLVAEFAYSESLLRGSGTVVDFFYLHHGGNDHGIGLRRASERVGSRLVIARSMIDSDEAPEPFRESVDQSVGNFRELHNELAGSGLVTAIPAPHSPHRASGDMVRAAARLAEQFETPWHIHLAEASSEVELTQRLYHATPLRWLESLGVLSPRASLVHGVWLDDEEIATIARTGTSLIHCAGSNQFLGDGIAPIRSYLDAGANVALGTDSGSANNHLNMFLEMRQAALLARVHATDQSALTAAQAFKMATAAGARITGLDVGRLAPGALADFVALDLDALSLQPSHNVLNNVVFSMESEAVQHVFVHGRQMVRDGKLTWPGAAELPERLAELSQRLGLA